MKRVWGVICMAGVLAFAVAGPAVAQRATVAAFDRTLETLRESVARLVKENAALNSDNLAARNRIKSLREEFRSLQAETRRLEDRQAAELRRLQGRSGGVEALKLQVAEADAALKRVRDEVAQEQTQFSALEDEEKTLRQKADALIRDIARVNKSAADSAAVREAFASLEDERGLLEKELADVANRVEEAKRQWQDVNAVVTTGPQQIEALQQERDKLVKAVSKAEEELDKANARLAEVQASFDRARSDDQAGARGSRLDNEVREMAERNRALEAEIVTMTQAREEEAKRIQADQQRAGDEYQARYEELLQRNVDLKAELDSLRKQMVDMDKRKVALEAELYPAR